MKVRYPVRLLVADRGPAEAAALTATMRRAGYTVDPKLARDTDALRDLLRERRWDLVLLGADVDALPMEDAMKLVHAAGGDAPVVVLEAPGGGPRATRIAALGLGARDVVARDDPEMLEFTARRELEALDQRRRLRRIDALRGDASRTLRTLVALAREPLAVLRRSDIVCCNGRFADTFGVSVGDDGARGALFGLVADDERDGFHALMDELWSGDERRIDVELTLRGVAGDLPGSRISLAPIAFDGVRLHTLLVRDPDRETTPARGDGGGPKRPIAPRLAESLRARDEAPRPALEIVGRRAAEVVPAQDAQAAEAPAPADSGPEPRGVVSREALLDAMREALAASRPAALAYVDVDNYAALKEHLGLGRIEQLHPPLRDAIAATLPESCLLARVTDDDYAILCPDLDPRAAADLGRAVEGVVSGAIFEVEGRTVLVSAGVGVALLASDDADPLQALDRAYQAAQSEIRVSPRLQHGLEEPELEIESESSLEDVARDLAAAMDDGRLSLVFQPVVRLRGEPAEIYETFLRYRDPAGEEVPPAEFLDAAARLGIRAQIDRWLVERALDLLVEHQRQGRRTRLFVKLSDQSIRDISIPLAIGRRRKVDELQPGRLIVEVAESAATGQIKAARTLMQAVRGFGCATALEHFGVSRHPFRLLDHVPADYLTIDSSIANRIADDPRCRKRLTEIAAIARRLDKYTVAEYVEDARSVALLYETGVDFVQGYYIQPPSERLDFEFSMSAG